jgi:hypothetical protein
MGWKHGAISNQLYRPEASLTGDEATPADNFDFAFHSLLTLITQFLNYVISHDEHPRIPFTTMIFLRNPASLALSSQHAHTTNRYLLR